MDDFLLVTSDTSSDWQRTGLAEFIQLIVKILDLLAFGAFPPSETSGAKEFLCFSAPMNFPTLSTDTASAYHASSLMSCSLPRSFSEAGAVEKAYNLPEKLPAVNLTLPG